MRRLWAVVLLALPASGWAASFSNSSFDTNAFSTGAFDFAAADTTAPILDNAIPSDFKAGSADLEVDTDEGNGTLYYVVTGSSTTPTSAQIEAGNDHNGNPAVQDGTLAITTAGTKTFDDVQISAGSARWAHFTHEDAAGNDSTPVSSVQFRVPADTDGPDEWSGVATTPSADTVFPSGTVAGDIYFVDRNAGTNVSVNSNGSVSADDDWEVTAQIWDQSANGGDGGLSATETTGIDSVVPTVDSATVASNGTTVTVVFSETVSIGSGGSGGCALDFSGGAATLTYSSGDGTSSLVFTASRTIESGETGTLDYTQPGDGIEDEAGNDLASFTDQAVTNDSGGDVTAPTFSSATIPSAGTSISVVFSENVTRGAGYANGDWSVSATGGAVTLTYSSGDGTDTLVLTTSRTIGPGETVTLGWAGTADGLEDDSSNDLASFSGESVTNNSTADLTAPFIDSATIPSGGTTIELAFDEAVVIGSGGDGGVTLSMSGGAVTASYSSGDGAATLVYSLSRSVGPTETGTVDYTQPGDGFEDAAGNDVASFSEQNVLNNSSADVVAPTLSSSSVNTAGDEITLSFDETVTIGSGGNGGVTLSFSGGAVTATYSSGDGSADLVYSLSRTIGLAETGTVAYTQPGNGVEDSAGNDLASFGATSVANGSTVDSVDPEQTAARISGDVLTLFHSEIVGIGAGGNGGVALSCSGGAVTATYSSGGGSLQLAYSLSRSVAGTETCTVGYTQPGNGIEDLAGNDLASYSGRAVSLTAVGNCLPLLNGNFPAMLGTTLREQLCAN